MAQRGAIALLFMLFMFYSHFSIFISPCFCFFSFSVQPLPITSFEFIVLGLRTLWSYKILLLTLNYHFEINICDYKVCTISKETKRKFNPVTKCEKVREVPCQAYETAMDF